MASQQLGQIVNVMKEARLFPPPEEFAAKARIASIVGYRRPWSKAFSDPEGFWGKLADQLHWFRPYQKVLEWDQPLAKWFGGGQTNVSYNCLEVRLDPPRRNKAALVWEGEPGETRVLTYQTLRREVCKFGNVLKGLGVERGDMVAIYMPMVPELPIAMRACARIGAVHSVVFAGFSAEGIADRNNDASAEVLITAEAGWRRFPGPRRPSPAVAAHPCPASSPKSSGPTASRPSATPPRGKITAS
jgi:acetyl-CoA synthetase